MDEVTDKTGGLSACADAATKTYTPFTTDREILSSLTAELSLEENKCLFDSLLDEINEEINCTEKVSFKLTKAKEFPSAGFLQKLCSSVYGKKSEIPKPWVHICDIKGQRGIPIILKIGAGLTARLFFNKEDRQMLIVFRGSSTIGDVLVDILSIRFRFCDDYQCDSAATIGVMARDILEKFKGRVQLIISGHSLGGYLAQIAAYSAKSMRLENGNLRETTAEDMEIYPHVVVFDSPPCSERILESSHQESVPKVLRLDVTNFIVDINWINQMTKTHHHCGRVICLGKMVSTKFHFKFFKNHGISNFSTIDKDPKKIVEDLNTGKLRTYDPTVFTIDSFSKSEEDELHALPFLRLIHNLDINYNISNDAVKIFDDEESAFVPKMRKYLLENKALLKEKVQQVEKFTFTIASKFWKLVQQEFEECDLKLKVEVIEALKNSTGDLFIKHEGNLHNKFILARILLNSISNTYFMEYKNFKKLDIKAKRMFLNGFEGFIILLLERGDNFENDTEKICRYIIVSEKCDATSSGFQSLEYATTEIIDEESIARLQKTDIDFFGRKLSMKELLPFFPPKTKLEDVYAIRHGFFEYVSHVSVPCSRSEIYVKQKLEKNGRDQTQIVGMDDILSLFSNSKKAQKIILSAGPGMGKTTFFNHLHEELATKLPNYWHVKLNLLEHSSYLSQYEGVNLKEITYNDSLHFLMRGKGIKKENDLTKTIFDHALKRKKVTVIFDAFDEICPRYRDVVRKLVSNLKKFRLSFAISTRPQELEGLKKKFSLKEFYTLTGLELGEVEYYFQKFFEIKEQLLEDEAKQKAADLMGKLTTAIEAGGTIGLDLHTFWKIPLHTVMMTELFFKAVNISEVKFTTLSALYDDFMIKSICRELTEKLQHDLAHPKFNLEKKKSSILKDLMLLAMAEKFHIPRKSIAKKKKDLKSTGIVIFGRYGKVTFVHNTFAEYLCARFCLENTNRKDVLEAMSNILKSREHWMIRKFLDEMVGNTTFPEISSCVDAEGAKLILNRLCRSNLLNLYRSLRNSGISFNYNERQVVAKFSQTDDDDAWESMGNESPSKRRRLDEEEIFNDFDDEDQEESEDLKEANKKFPLAMAIQYASEEMVEELLQNGASIRTLINLDSDYEAALFMATHRGMERVVELIEKTRPLRGIDDYKNLSVLCEAVKAKNLSIVKFLIDAGANVYAKNGDGQNAIMVAESIDAPREIIDLLLTADKHDNEDSNTMS